MKVSAEEIKRVKGLGCLKDKRYEDVFNVRVPTGCGRLTSEQGRMFAEAAERFGSGEFCLTTRLTIEIQGVRFENIEPLRAFLAEHGFQSGGTGSKVRPVVACKGTTCVHGLIDTAALAMKLHERFYIGMHDTALPHKFKIGVGGCPNNCIKPELNDIGVMGRCMPELDAELCRSCARCAVEEGCPVHAAERKDGRPVLGGEGCNSCGSCLALCPFGAVKEKLRGYKVFIGGRWGKRTGVARPLAGIVETEEELIALIERIIAFYRETGNPGERFADTIARIGFENVERALLEKQG